MFSILLLQNVVYQEFFCKKKSSIFPKNVIMHFNFTLSGKNQLKISYFVDDDENSSATDTQLQ